MCVLVDDMIDTGGTIVKAAEALMADGAAGVVIAATHAILSEPAVDRLKNSPATEVVVTNTLPVAAEREFDKLTGLSIAPLVSRAIRRSSRTARSPPCSTARLSAEARPGRWPGGAGAARRSGRRSGLAGATTDSSGCLGEGAARITAP